MVALLAVASTCASDAEPNAAPANKAKSLTTASTVATEVAHSASDLEDCPHRPSGSSPASFDRSGGTYAAQSLLVVGANELRFDIVQWLSGQDATDAYFAETSDASGPPNDYFIRNDSNQTRTAPVAASAHIYLLRSDGHVGSLHLAKLTDVPTEGTDERIFWLTFSDGDITEICHQYRP